MTASKSFECLGSVTGSVILNTDRNSSIADMHSGRITIFEASEGVKYIFCRIPSVVIAPTAKVYGGAGQKKTNILSSTRICCPHATTLCSGALLGF